MVETASYKEYHITYLNAYMPFYRIIEHIHFGGRIRSCKNPRIFSNNKTRERIFGHDYKKFSGNSTNAIVFWTKKVFCCEKKNKMLTDTIFGHHLFICKQPSSSSTMAEIKKAHQSPHTTSLIYTLFRLRSF